MTDEPIDMLHPPMNDEQLDSIERAAAALIDAIEESDYDSALIIASTSENPPMLAMFVTEMLLSMVNAAEEDEL
jgi:rhodanese-related sulfurtransferase